MSDATASTLGDRLVRPGHGRKRVAGWGVPSPHRGGRRHLVRGRELIKLGDEGDLLAEHEILTHLGGTPGVPRVIALDSLNGEPELRIEWIRGRRLDQVDLSLPELVAVIGRALVMIGRLARRGVSHNDLRAENWIIGSEGRLHLVDFERARVAGPLTCLRQALLRLRGGPAIGLGDLVRSWIRDRLPPGLLRRLRRCDPRPASLVDGPSEPRRLERAWRRAALSGATSPGRRVAYYRLRCGGLDLPGERDFGTRWRVLRRAVDWRGQRVMELGCNLALLSIFALRDEGAAAALAVDRDPAILDAAAEAAGAFAVAPTFQALDLDDTGPWEDRLLAWRPDVVAALSLLAWVGSPDRLLRFLVRCPLVLVEGHGSVRIERRRLLDAGFAEVERIMTTDRGRPLFRCRSR